ncbi:MAG: YhcG family protein [Rubinisphaera brasiliensis]|uniref:PDDEXK nuclease domain-containing protein n=1 Tax=Rubinisphaera brasiliensis TaxID=119 RepID=UPI003919F512
MAKKKGISKFDEQYSHILTEMVDLLESARRLSARAVNSVMTATYWEIGRRIVELEQGGKGRAPYGQELLPKLATDLTKRFGRGFSRANLEYMRRFFECWRIPQTPSGESENKKPQTPSGEFKEQSLVSYRSIQDIAPRFPLPWSHYVKLLSIQDEKARSFYEQEALRGGWSVRQLKRQIDSQFYQRTLLSKNKAAMLRKGEEPLSDDLVTPEEQIKDPLVLEFLDLKDEYSEHDLEEALVHKLEEFLLELGSDFAFIGRQKRLRIGDEWYRIDLLFFHRRLRCLVVIDLKIGKFTHADSGQMHMYLNYAAEHWTHDDENPPVGLILCAEHDEAVARYSLEGLPNKVMAAEYKLALPDEAILVAELEKTQRELEHRGIPVEAGSKQTLKRKTTKKQATSCSAKRKSKKKP